MDVKFWIQEHFHPVVAVSASPAAEAICVGKNGLSVVDMLRPYSVLHQLNVPMRVGETSSRVMDLRLNFHSAQHMFQPKTEVVDEHLKHVLLVASSRFAKQEPLENLLASIQAGSGQDYTPWYSEYREEFLRMLCFGEHEAFDHPVACMYVIPADAPDPLSHFQQLVQKGPLPPLMEKEVMFPFKDPLFPKHYVLLHDGYVGGDEAWAKAQENLKVIDRTFGANHCALVRINTAKADAKTAGAPPDLFKRFRRATLTGGGAGEPEQLAPEPPCGLGGRLSVTDVDALQQLVRDFSTKTLLPKLEDRINRLNTNITASKRGLRNRLSRFLVAKVSNEAASNDIPYPHHSTESQMRQLADLAFLLRHYDFAAAMYRLAAPDYMSQHSYKWYAGAEEMIGLCAIMEASETSDPMKYFTRAWENYSKCAGRQNRMLATRAMIFCATYQTGMGRHLSTNHILMRAHFEEENARAALLLEQAGYSLLYLKQPFIRRFAFHMVLAGLRYHSCEQKRLAIHAYRQVLGVYYNRDWLFIEEHLNDILGKQCREFGDTDGSLRHFVSLLCCTHRPLSTQQHYIQQFLDAVKKVEVTQKDASHPVVESLKLPLVNGRDIEVQHWDHRCYSGQAAYRVGEAAWGRLEQSVVLSANSEMMNWSVKQVVNHEEYNTCVIGEDICVRVEFTNPLQVKLKVSQLKLCVEFSETQSPEAAPPAPDPAADPTLLAKQLHLSEDGCTMQAGETLSVLLRVCPRVGGWLRITGVRWCLNDTVEGRASFNVKGRKRKKPKGDRPSQQKHYPPNRRLLFFIIPTMPRLDVTCEAMPTTLYQGELCRVLVRLSNRGNAPLRNLHLITSTSHLALDMASCRPVNQGPKGSPLKEAGEQRPRAETGGDHRLGEEAAGVMELAAMRVNLSKEHPELQGHIYKFDKEGMDLAVGESATVWMWLHPQSAGGEKYQCVWYCEPQDDSAVMKYRTLRMCHPLSVTPLLRVRPAVSPAAKDLFRYLLRLDFDNSKEGVPIQLERVGGFTAGAGSPWQLSVVTQGEASPHKGLNSLPVEKRMLQGETGTLFYLLHPPTFFRSLPGDHSGSSNPDADDGNSPGASGFSAPARHFHRAFARTLAAQSDGPRMADPALDIMLSWSIQGTSNPPVSSTTSTGTAPGPAASGAPPGTASSGTTPGTAVSGIAHSTAASGLAPRTAAACSSSGGTALSSIASGGAASLGPLGPTATDQGLSGGNHAAASRGPSSGETSHLDRGPRSGLIHLYDVVGAHNTSPVRLMMDGQTTVRHDFRKHTMCVAPVTLTLRNCYSSPSTVTILAGPDKIDAIDTKHAWLTLPPPAGLSGPPSIDLRPQSSGQVGDGSLSHASSLSRSSLSQSLSHPSFSPASLSRPSLSQPAGSLSSISHQHGMSAGLAPAPEYLWCGATLIKVEDLQPGATAQVKLQISVFKPGVFLVGDYSCRYELTAEGKTLSKAQPGSPFLLQVQALAPTSPTKGGAVGA